MMEKKDEMGSLEKEENIHNNSGYPNAAAIRLIVPYKIQHTDYDNRYRFQSLFMKFSNKIIITKLQLVFPFFTIADLILFFINSYPWRESFPSRIERVGNKIPS